MGFTKKNYIDLTGLTTFKTAILSTAINDSNKTNTKTTATVKAIADYVDSEVKDLSDAVTTALAGKVSSVSYDPTNKKLVYNKGGSANTDIVSIATIKSDIGNFVKSGTGASSGLVPAPSTTAGTSKYLREDGTWSTPPDTNTVPQGHCTTSASDAAKTATCSNYSLLDNSYLTVIMANANSKASALTLNVNGKGAKPIYINGSASSSSNYTLPAGSYLTYYDGTNYYFRTDGKITGNITGSASSASSADQVKTKSDSTDATRYITFVDSNNTNATAETVYTNTDLKYNPSTKTLTAGIFSGALNGNASTATKLQTVRSLKITDGTNTSTGVSFDGNADVTLNLPSTIKATFSGDLTGNASTATALTTSAGSTTTPIYFSEGKPTSTGYTFESSVSTSSNTTKIPTSSAVVSYVSSILQASDAMIYKGTLGTGGTITALPTKSSSPLPLTGWTYKVITAGTYANQKCEIGDMIVCLTDATTSVDPTWTVIQSNIDGAVTSEVTSTTDGRIPLFSGTNGKVIKDSSKTINTSVTDSDSYIPTSKAVKTFVEGKGYVTSSGVTSVGLSLPSSILEVTGSPVTSTGTLTGSLKKQNANTVFAGPDSGSSAAVPTFRSLVAADLPTVPYNKGGTGLTTYTKGDILYASDTDTISKLKIGTAGQVLKVVSGVPAWSTDNDNNYYPTKFAWSGGTTSGPTGSLTGSGMTAVTFGAIPSASGTASGVVTTGDQTFKGTKTFSDKINIASKVTLQYNSTTESLDFVFA